MSNEKNKAYLKKWVVNIKVGDYYVPDFGQFDEEEDEIDNRPLGKYGMMREAYLKEHHKPLYNHLLLSGKLDSHLLDVNEEAQNLLDSLLPQYKGIQGVTEDLKVTNQFEWIGRMNNIVSQIEEVILNEIVYV